MKIIRGLLNSEKTWYIADIHITKFIFCENKNSEQQGLKFLKNGMVFMYTVVLYYFLHNNSTNGRIIE